MNHSRIENLIKTIKTNEENIKEINAVILDYKQGRRLTLSIRTVNHFFSSVTSIPGELLEAFLVMERSVLEKKIAQYNEELRKEVAA